MPTISSPAPAAPQVGPVYAWSLVVVMACAFVSFFLSFQAGIFLLFFAIVGWWVWEHPREGFLFFVVVAPLLPMFKITQTISTITLVKDVIIATLFVKLFFLSLVTQRLPYRRNVLFAPLLLLVVWTGVEALRSESLVLGVLRARDIVLYVLLYFAVLYLPWDRAYLRRCASWFFTSVIAVLVLSVYQWFFAVDSAVLRFDPARQIWIPRLSGTLAHPSIFGQYLIVSSVLAGVLAAVASSVRVRVLGAVFFVGSLPFVYLTYSRAVWIGLVVACASAGVVFVAIRFRDRAARAFQWRYVAGAGIAALLVLVLLLRFTAVGVFLRSAIDPTYGSNVERFEFATRLIAPMTSVEALLGRGLGDVLSQQFRTVDVDTYDIATGAARSVQLAKNRTLVDNQHLKTFVEMGLAGLLIYGWLYWRFARAAFSLAGTPMGFLGLWGIGFLAAFVVQGFFIDIWDIFPTNAIFWIIAALVSGWGVVAKEKLIL